MSELHSVRERYSRASRADDVTGEPRIAPGIVWRRRIAAGVLYGLAGLLDECSAWNTTEKGMVSYLYPRRMAGHEWINSVLAVSALMMQLSDLTTVEQLQIASVSFAIETASWESAHAHSNMRGIHVFYIQISHPRFHQRVHVCHAITRMYLPLRFMRLDC